MIRNHSHWVVAYNYMTGEVRHDHSFSHRFSGDKVFVDNEEELIIADGVVLNSPELKQNHDTDSVQGLYKHILNGSLNPAELFGPFTAFVYNKQNSKGMAFGNQTGDASVFYFLDEVKHEVVLSNNFNVLFYSTPHARCQLDEDSAYQLLSHGFLCSDNTIVKGFKKLRAGTMLLLAKGETPNVKVYHHFDFLTKSPMTMDDAIEGIDKRFRRAVKLCYDKDLEYGYTKHITSISAGLDSRMVNLVAKDLGYTGIVNDCYSQTGSDEERYAFELEKYLGNQMYFRQLDDHSFIYDIENICRLRFGMAYYIADACKTQIDDTLDWDSLGLLHTGELGDHTVSGSYLTDKPFTWNPATGRNSSKLPIKDFEGDYSCDEDWSFYGRQFQFIVVTSYSASEWTYIVSPFLDPSFIQYCLTIPNSLRYGHRLYWAWIDKKYPEAGKIPSTRDRCDKAQTWNDMLQLHWRGIKSRGRNMFYPFLHRLGLRDSSVSRNHMNPYDYWYETNSETRNFIDNFFANHLYLLDNFPEIKTACKKVFSGNAFDKLLAISLLATIKAYSLND